MSLSPFPVRGRSGAGGIRDLARGWLADFTASTFYRAARISLRTIYALVLREARTRYGRQTAGYVWALIQPLFLLFILLVVFDRIDRAPAAGDSTIVFFVTGMMPLYLFRNSVTRGASAIRSSRGMMNYPQVRGFEVVSARVVLEFLTYTLVTFVIILFMMAFTGLPLTHWGKNLGELLCALGGLFLLCYGASFLSAQIGRLFAQWTDLTRALGRLLLFTSGLWYTFATLPDALRVAASYNPLAQEIEWIRDSTIHGFESDLFTWSYPVAFGAICLVIGLFIEWLVRISGYDTDRSRL